MSGRSAPFGLSGSQIAVAVLGFLGVLGGLLVLGVIADEVREQEAIALDALATPFLHGLASPGLDNAMHAATELGSTVVVAPLFAIVLVVLLWFRHRRAVLFLFLAMAGSIALNQTLKLVFQRPRPQLPWAQAPPEFSFPSGHAMNSLVFYVTLALVVWWIRGRRAGRLSVAAALAVAAIVGASRIYLGFHYLSDVVAGYLAGLMWLLVVATVFELPARLRRGPRAREVGRSMEATENTPGP